MFKPKGTIFLALVFTLLSLSCSDPESEQPLLTAEMPLHLEEHIDDARIEGSEVSHDIEAPVEWDFSEPQPDWKPLAPLINHTKPIQITPMEDALRLTKLLPRGVTDRFIYIDLPDYRLADWASILVSARTSDKVGSLLMRFNLQENWRSGSGDIFLATPENGRVPMINDGSVHTYEFKVNRIWNVDSGITSASRDWEHSWKQLIIGFRSMEPVSLDLLSVTIIPKEGAYAYDPVGVGTESQNRALRRILYTHTPGRIEYRVQVPEAGRLDLGLGVLRDDVPVNFRIAAELEDGEVETLLQEACTDQEHWTQRSLDLSHLAGRVITLTLEADSERSGIVALWAAPTLTGKRATEKPNIIFYVIDGGSPDNMSVYGYNRRTTPNLERLATEGALFENVYSNSTYTAVSTPSFMTSLHTSVMGGAGSGSGMVPEQAVTMAEHMHKTGYQTAVFTTNPYASMNGGVDVLRDSGYEGDAVSSVLLHDKYWKWRDKYPGEPYWVHFQTTDVHWSEGLPSPYSGLYVSPELRERFINWERQLEEAGGRTLAANPYSIALAKAGIDPDMHSYVQKGLFDEMMAHQDYQLGRLVERLKEVGEWEHTLLIVAADHGGSSPGPPRDQFFTEYDPMFRREETRVPLLIVWPGHIAGGQRFSQTVSMIDVLPTILDLIGLPKPEVIQGQSLAPLLLGEEGWERRPVILDEFFIDRGTGELRGYIEVVDGRWGASLIINGGLPPYAFNQPQRTIPLLLYDLWDDPYTLHSLHEERPDLVGKYTRFLEARFVAHLRLGQRLTRSRATSPLTHEQLEALRALGYID